MHIKTLPALANAFGQISSLRKMLLIMRITIFLLLATALQLSARTTYSQNVSITSRDISLEKVIRLLKQQTGYSFLCTQQVLEKARHIQINIKEASLPDALATCLMGHSLKYSIQESEKVVFIEEGEALPIKAVAPAPIIADAPPTDVFGRVVNEKGDGIADASIKISGKTKGIVTDAKGYFKIKANDNDTLVFTYVGYEEQRIAVSKNKDIIEVSLKPVVVPIAEVVVVGYGKQKKASVVGAVSTVNAADLEGPGSQLSQTFAGNVAGVIAVQSSGEPGKNAASFWIRGVATPGTTTPLVFLDGVEISTGDMNSIDPVNIESFSVLKDASATALYGARGANGVVLITTKRGKNLAKPVITTLVENSFVSPTKLPKFADAVTYMNDYNEAVANDNIFVYGNPNLPLKYTQDQINGTQKGLNPYIYPNVDWYNILFKPVSLRQHANINIRGGSAKARYYMGASYYRDEGILKNQPNNGFNNNIIAQRFNFINNISVDVTKTTEAELNISSDYNPYTGPATAAATIFNEVINTNPVHFPALFPASDTAGHLYFGNATGGFQNGFTNPYADMVKGYTQSFTSTVLSTVRINQKLDFITKGLSANLLASFKNYSSTSITRGYTPYMYAINTYNYDSTAQKYNYSLTQIGTNGSTAITQSNSNGGNRTLYFQAMVNYDRSFGKHAITGLLVYQQKEYNINVPTTDIVASLPQRNQGVSGRVTYAYNNKYFAEGNFGYTGSENFAPGHKFGFFPSIGVGYLISNEDFFSPLKGTITSLKIRASKGLAGNDQIPGGRFPYTPIINLSSSGTAGTGGTGYTFGQNLNNSRNGVLITRYDNPSITWEKSDKTNIGFDLELHHVFTLTVDMFREIRSNIFQQRATVPSTLGYGSALPYANIEKVQNQGIDLAVGYTYHVNKDLLITARGTFTFARNKVAYIDEPNYIYPYLAATGRPINQLRGLIADHLFGDSTEIAKNPSQSGYGRVSPGDIKYKDVSSAYDTLNVINDNDKVPMGHPSVPEITYGFGVNVSYKKWDVKIFFQGIANNSFFMNNVINSNNTTSGITPFGLYQNNLLQAIADNHWSRNNRNAYAFYPALSDATSPNNTQPSTWWLRSGAFLRLKYMEFGYSPIPIVRVYVSGSNLLTFSKFKLWDPELSANTSINNGLGYPPERVINVGVQVTLK